MEDVLQQLTKKILQFRDERDWAQFHTPKNLAAALSIECAELQELMLWKSDSEIADLAESADYQTRVHDELADVLIYSLLLAHALEVDVKSAVTRKLEKNALKYPVEKAHGNARKYDQL